MVKDIRIGKLQIGLYNTHFCSLLTVFYASYMYIACIPACNDVSLQKKTIHHRKADTYALNTEIKLNICRSTMFCAVVLCKLEHTCASLQLL